MPISTVETVAPPIDRERTVPAELVIGDPPKSVRLTMPVIGVFVPVPIAVELAVK